MFQRAPVIKAIVICAACALTQSGSTSELLRIDRNDLCVTNGAVSVLPGGQFAIDTPSSRAVVRASETPADEVAEIRFRYLGPTSTSKPLASGELRRQIGLKLRAEDTCNLIYVMWHIEPDARVAVSVKRNVGMRTHEQCHAGGYLNMKAQKGVDLPPVRAGEAHTLRAELHGDDLKVTADGKTAWRGALGDEAQPLNGPPGFRTDNARFEFEFYSNVPATTGVQAGRRADPGGCVASEGD